MSDIKFSCPQCQQHIQCEPAYAGTQVSCPQCGARMVVPGQAPAPAPTRVAAPGCPGCGAALQPGAVVCTACGYNLRTGQRLQVQPAATPQTRHAPSASPSAAQPARTSQMAIWSLVLGILGAMCGITAIPGLILGIISLNKIGKSRGELSGRGLGMAGTILSGFFVVAFALALLFFPIFLGAFSPALARAKERAMTVQCVNNTKTLCLGAIMFATDNQDRFPPAATWCDAIAKTLAGPGQPFKCLAGDQSQRSHYAMNARLGGIQRSRIRSPNLTVLFFETQGGWNLSGGPELLLLQPRHSGMVVVGFADGHSEEVTQALLRNLRWDP